MKRKFKAIVALTICLCLAMKMITPVLAAGESNTQGVTFEASLDTPSIEVSDVDQTVKMRVTASEPVTLESIGLTVVWDEVLTLTSVENDDSRIDFSGSVNTENGVVSWDGTSSLEQLADVTNIATVTFTVPAGTPAGSYTVGVKEISLTSGYGTKWENGATASATLTITEPVTGYTAGLSTTTADVSVSETATINVAVGHSDDESFAAGEIIVTYDAEKLTFNKDASKLGAATVTDNEGTLKLEDYGADKTFGTGVYVLAFDAIAAGDAVVTLTSAAFVDKEDAVKSDLIPATITTGSVPLTISGEAYAVTLPEIFTGPATVADGESYTFSVADGDNYNYDSVTATMGGVDVKVNDNGNGTYTIENVTGALVITGTRNAKTYSVAFEGTAAGDITDGAANATYGTDYTFTMPTAEGFAHSLESITIGGTAYTGYTVAGSVYTISGTAITGDIVITVNKSATEAAVTVEGTGAGTAAGYKATATIGEEYTLTIAPESGYTYTVTATMNGETATVTDNDNNTYTIANVTGDIVFTVERTVVTTGVSVSEDVYLPLDGTNMWLVTNKIVVAADKVPTYDGEKMFWSEKYNAYCYLVIAQTLDAEDAKAKVGITDGTAVEVNYGMDVNMTGKVDASDAQLTYNMYNASYSGFTTEVTMEKFLRADVNGDSVINTQDAVAIITAILGN